MSVALSPIYTGQQFLDSNGDPLQGFVWTYEAGSFSVPLETYTTIVGDVPNPNPIPLDSAGRLTPDLWLLQGQLYNLVLRSPSGEIIDSVDNVTGTPLPSSGGGGGGLLWVELEEVPTFLNSTSFQVPGNFINEFAVGNRVRANLNGTFRYGTVQTVSFTAPNTNVTLALDGSPLTSALSSVAWSQITAVGLPGDAGAIRYTEELPYATAGSVGNKIKTLSAVQLQQALRYLTSRRVQTANGTGTYTLDLNPPLSAYTDEQIFTVRFTNGTTAPSTLNINGLGAVNIRAYDAAGNKATPSITNGQVSDIAYDGTDFILLDQRPGAAPAPPPVTITPRGAQGFASNGTFTTPADVFFLKVTCVGGGGGGSFIPASSDPFVDTGGAGGGGGAVSFNHISTTPGSTYSVVVGAGGLAGGPVTEATNGGTTSFGISICSAQGGFAAIGATPGNGGSTGNGFVLSGGRGVGRIGGAAPGWGEPDQNFGGGGSGNPNGATPANAGRQGLVLVEW